MCLYQLSLRHEWIQIVKDVTWRIKFYYRDATFYVTCMEMKHKYLEVKDSKTKRDITEFQVEVLTTETKYEEDVEVPNSISREV